MTTNTKDLLTQRIEALSTYLKIEISEVKESTYDETTFEADGCEYLVLTDDEADDIAKTQILDSVWGFRKSFLDSHSEAISEIDEKTFSKLQEGCESINKAILAMIDDKEHFVEDAIKSDGRGHFIAQYDNEENDQKVDDTHFFIYRTN